MWGEAGGAHWLEQDSASQASIQVPVLSQAELESRIPCLWTPLRDRFTLSGPGWAGAPQTEPDLTHPHNCIKIHPWDLWLTSLQKDDGLRGS